MNDSFPSSSLLPPTLLQVILGRGAMVDVLVQSDVARYLEFQAVKRLLSPRQGKMEPVPCSRADLFSTKEVSMPEKRKMMKFLTFCAEFEKHPEEYEGEYEDDVDERTGREWGWEREGVGMGEGRRKGMGREIKRQEGIVGEGKVERGAERVKKWKRKGADGWKGNGERIFTQIFIHTYKYHCRDSYG